MLPVVKSKKAEYVFLVGIILERRDFMRKLGLAVMCVMGSSLLLCAGCASEKEEVWTSAEYVEQNWEETIPMLALLQENQEGLVEQASQETATFDLQQENAVQSEMQFVTVASLKNEQEELGKKDAEQSEELMLFASEPKKYEGERSEEVKNRQEQKIQEANEKTKYVKENVIPPLLEQYEKQIKRHFVKNEEEKEYIEIHWSYNYMQDMTSEEKETYIIYLTAVNIWREPNGDVTALPWCDITVTVSKVEKEEKSDWISEKEEVSWDYNIVLELREDGSMLIRRNE